MQSDTINSFQTTILLSISNPLQSAINVKVTPTPYSNNSSLRDDSTVTLVEKISFLEHELSEEKHNISAIINQNSAEKQTLLAKRSAIDDRISKIEELLSLL